MMLLDVGDSRHVRGLLLVLALFSGLYLAIRRSPKDRVLLYQTIALGSFVVGAIAIALAQLSGWSAFLCLIPFVISTICVGYFALMNWFRRRKQAG